MKQFFYDNQTLLLDLANTEAGRYLLDIKNKDKIVKLSPNSIHQLKERKKKKVIIQARFYAKDLIAEKLLPIITKIEIANEHKKITNLYEAFLHYSGLEEKNYPYIHLTTFNVTGAGLANSEGGLVSPNVSFDTFTNCRTGSITRGTNVNGDLNASLVGFSGGNYALIRYFCKINYTALPAAAVVTAASFNLNARYFQAEAADAYRVCAGNQSDTLATSDWGNGNLTTLWGTGSTPSGTGQHYEACTLNATGIAAITATNVKYAIISESDYSNSAPGKSNGPIPNTAAGTNPPYVDVTYSIPVAESPLTKSILTFNARSIGKSKAIVDIESNVSNGTITERGIYYSSTNSSPTSSDSGVIYPTTLGTTGRVSLNLSRLTASTRYYVRGYIIISGVTYYGNTITFVTASVNVLKHYFYKVFSASTGRQITTWTKEVISEPKFSVNINGGPGPISVLLARPFDSFGESQDVNLNNRIETYVVDEDNTDGLLLHSGYISGYKPIVREREEFIEVTIFSFTAELSRIILRDSSGNTTLTYTNYDPSAILRDVIDKYRRLGGRINYSSVSIQNTNTTVSYTFNTNTVKECIDAIVAMCPDGWYWRIDADNTIYLQAENVLATHTFILGLHVEKLETFRRIEDLVNRVLFTGAGDPPLFRQYDNSSSQTQYGLYAERMVDLRVSDANTAQAMANRLINAKKDPEIRSIFEILDNNGPNQDKGYDIESIKVGDTLRVANLKSGIASFTLWDVAVWDVDVWDQTLENAAADVIQIIAIRYYPDSIELEASSRLPLISQRIEQVNNDFENSITVNNPSAPT